VAAQKTHRTCDSDKYLSKNVLLLGVTSFLTDLSSEMIFPLLPLFIVNILHADTSIVGLIDGIAESTADLGKMVSGWYSDKIKKRKQLILSGYGLSSFTKPFFALATAWPHVLVVRFLDRVGKGLRGTARDAMIADETSIESRGRAFGYRKMMDQLGAVLGPLAAYLLLPYFTARMPEADAYRTIFWLSFIPAILAVIVLLFVREKVVRIAEKKKMSISAALGPDFKKFLLVTLVFALGTFSYSFLILKAQEAGVSVNNIPLLYLSFNVSYMVFAMPIGTSSDKIGRKKILACGYLTFGLMCVGLIYAKTAFSMWLLFIVYGVFMAVMETVQRAYISDIISHDIRGTALGLHQGASGFAALPANLMVGILWSTYGSQAAFAYAIAVTAISLVLLALLVKESRKAT
jgi:MFS family permease